MTSVASGANPRVLVVGAGPVGLVAALRLREQGLAVRVVDEQAAESKRSYPALLHARTLRILAELGVSAPLEWRGRAITRLSVYGDGLRRLTLQLPSAEPVAPGALTPTEPAEFLPNRRWIAFCFTRSSHEASTHPRTG